MAANDSDRLVLNPTTGKKITTMKGAENYLEDNNFMILENPGGGNCLFYTLSAFGAVTGYSRLNKPHYELRRDLVDYMEMNKKKLYLQGLRKMHLNRLRKTKKYNCKAGDVAPEFLNLAFKINVNLYNFKKKFMLNHYEYPTSKLTINILRDGEHFRLLIPMDNSYNNTGIGYSPINMINALNENTGLYNVLYEDKNVSNNNLNSNSNSPNTPSINQDLIKFLKRKRTVKNGNKGLASTNANAIARAMAELDINNSKNDKLSEKNTIVTMKKKFQKRFGLDDKFFKEKKAVIVAKIRELLEYS
jgi:hypothetical protein